jgi:hypothetical protein
LISKRDPDFELSNANWVVNVAYVSKHLGVI